ncbi:MAG: sulfite exporter TauE/SafE family protein, partial [Rhodocyclaceae bacterium]|nr:sulfite exporter TauE/SafE family protein [Rhodocyclaceae bacterium]
MGLMSGVHCVAMCGGIVGALGASTGGQTHPLLPRARLWAIHFAYSAGRVATYCVLGAVLGALGASSLLLENVLPVQMVLYVLANLLLVAMGLYLMGRTRLLAPLERAGSHLWRRVQPLTRRWLPVRGVAQALPLGMLWGFLPCAMVYGMLATALFSGSASRGALTMLAFGLGTLPNLLLAGMAFRAFREWTRRT